MHLSLAVFSLLVAPAVSDQASCMTLFLELTLACTGASSSTFDLHFEINDLAGVNTLRTCYCTTNSNKLQQAVTECAGTEMQAAISSMNTLMCDSTCIPDLYAGQTACSANIYSAIEGLPTGSMAKQICADSCRSFFAAGAPTSCQSMIGSDWTSFQNGWNSVTTELGTGNGKLCNPCVQALLSTDATCPEDAVFNAYTSTGSVPSWCSGDCFTSASAIISQCDAASIVGSNISGTIVTTSYATAIIERAIANATSLVTTCPVPSPPPPPPPSPPPPLTKVSIAMTASGTVDDYTDAKINSISASVATDVGVDSSLVATNVAAGSVTINSVVTVPQDKDATSVESALNTNWGTAAKAGSKLSDATGDTVTVTSDPTLTTVVPSEDDDDGFPIAVVVGAAAGGSVVLIIIGVAIYCMMKKSSGKGPPGAKASALPLA